MERSLSTMPTPSSAEGRSTIFAGIYQLELAGTPIGGNDLIIAAQAITLDLTLTSDNGGNLHALPACASKLVKGLAGRPPTTVGGRVCSSVIQHNTGRSMVT